MKPLQPPVWKNQQNRERSVPGQLFFVIIPSGSTAFQVFYIKEGGREIAAAALQSSLSGFISSFS
jgi:hypothetical protein